MKEFKVSENVLQVMLDYLTTRPYKEVFQLIREIQRSEIIIKDSYQEEAIGRNGKPETAKEEKGKNNEKFISENKKNLDI
jgi:hypothetical protein